MRSPRFAVTAFMGACLVSVAVIYLLFFRLWVIAGVLSVIAFAAFTASLLLLRRTDPVELKALAARNEKWVELWARSFGRAAGGWQPRSRRRRD
jgi:hypothetical protein